jgi:hypothetical protein
MVWDGVPPAYGGIGDTVQVGGMDSTMVTKQLVTSPEAHADKVDSARVINSDGGPVEFGDTLIFQVWGTSTTVGAEDAIIASPTVSQSFRADTLDILNSVFTAWDALLDTLVVAKFNDLEIVVPTALAKARYEAFFQFFVNPTPFPVPSSNPPPPAAAGKTMANSPNIDTTTVIPVFIVASGVQNKFLRPDEVLILPVELISFTAIVDGSDIILEWRTASEKDNAGFQIEKSISGGTWTDGAWLPGQGNSNYLSIYESRVRNVEAGSHRFRLKQVDFDGAFEYSPIIEVSTEIPGTHLLSGAYPNPFNPTTNFSLSVGVDQEVKIALYDVTGRLVQTIFDGSMKGNETRLFSLDANTLPSGTYTYVVTGANFRDSRNVVLLR